MNIAAGIDALRRDGFVVFDNVVPASLCDAVIDAIGSECGVRLDDSAT